VRSAASSSSGIITALSNGSYVTLISKSGDWWQVEYEKDKYGYCHGAYINVLSGSYAASLTATVNVRSGPGTTYDIVSWASSGQNVVIIGFAGDWNNVLVNGNQVGYIKGSYMVAANTGYSSVSLDVVSFKQFDSRWAWVEVGTSGKNIKSIGCATTSIAMSESYRTGTTIYPDQMEAKLKYTADGSIYWPSNYTGYAASDYLSKAYSLLKSGKPVLIGLKTKYGNQHWVLITGFKGGTTLDASAFTVNDPASSYNYTLQSVMSAYPYFYKLVHY
jgi:uncharacterized protein YgiM (DUF1202 family)